MFVTDLDDTLYNEIDYVRSGYRAIGRELERAGMMACDDAVKVIADAANTATGFDNLSALLWEKHPGNSYDVKWMVDTYRFHYPDIKLRADALEMLEQLKMQGVTIGLITDGRAATQRAKIKALGIERFIDEKNIIISGETGYDKTFREPFDLIASRNPGETMFLYLGDNPAKDFRWPNAMGWETVEILDGAGIHIHSQRIDVPPEYRARHTIAHLTDVFALDVR